IGIFFIIGYRMLFKIRVLPVWRTLGYSFFLLLFISLAIAFIHSFFLDYPHFLEGEFGFWTNRLLQAQIGNAGIGGMLTFAGLTMLILAYNIDFRLPERKKKLKEVD